MTLAPPRENTLGKVTHPDRLRVFGDVLTLIEDPLADRIAKGDPTFGWEGDERYALYVNPRAQRWELWRLEADNVYRRSVVVPGFVKGVEAVAWVVRWIVDHDGRRGFSPAEFVIQENIRTQKARDAAMHARNEEAADRLHHGLTKDLGHLEGMTHRHFTSPGVPERTP